MAIVERARIVLNKLYVNLTSREPVLPLPSHILSVGSNFILNMSIDIWLICFDVISNMLMIINSYQNTEEKG